MAEFAILTSSAVDEKRTANTPEELLVETRGGGEISKGALEVQGPGRCNSKSDQRISLGSH